MSRSFVPGHVNRKFCDPLAFIVVKNQTMSVHFVADLTHRKTDRMPSDDESDER